MDFVLTLQKEYRSMCIKTLRDLRRYVKNCFINLKYEEDARGYLHFIEKSFLIKQLDDFMRMEKDEEIIWVFADPSYIQNNIFLTNHGKIYYILYNTVARPASGLTGYSDLTIMTELVYHNVLIPKNHITIIKTLLKNIIGSTRIEATPNDSLRWNNTNFDTIYKNLTELLESMKPPPPKEICKCDGVCYGACNAVYG